MLVDFLAPIYEDAEVISRLKYVIERIRLRDSHRAVLLMNELFPKLCHISTRYMQLDAEEGLKFWNHLQCLNQVEADLVLLGDIIENQILPRLATYMSTWGHIEEIDENKFKLESTVSGFLTIKDINRDIYFHSTIDPMEEARKLAEYIYLPEKKEFALLGCGLGYLPYQIYKMSKGSTKIYIYESNEKILEYAYQFGVLSWIPEECITIISDPDILLFLNQLEDNGDIGFYMFFPELGMLPDDCRDVMIDLFMEYNTSKIFELDSLINYWRNRESDSRPIYEFDRREVSEEIIVVAAGPSLDDNIDFLRENKGKRTIISVGTVFRKLLNLGIEPDMVTILDPQERTYKQIEGLEDQQVPMIMSNVAFWKFAHKYQGEKYLVQCTDVSSSKWSANNTNEECWDCGGTVTSLAMQVAIWCGAKKIYFVGVDLAYQKDGVSHASNTMDCSKRNIDGMQPVEGVGGTTVYADVPFVHYRQWMEGRIKETPEIEYINLSKIGARIAGAKEIV